MLIITELIFNGGITNLLAQSFSVALALGSSSEDAFHIRSLGLRRTTESVGGSSTASRDLVAVVLGSAAFGVDVLELAVGVATSGTGKVSSSGIALFADLNSRISAHRGDSDGGGS